MQHVSTSEARKDFAEIINKVAYGKEPVIIGRRGKELAAVIPMRDLRLLERLIEEEEDRLDVAEASRIEAEEPESIPWDEVRRDLLEGATLPAPTRKRTAASYGTRNPARAATRAIPSKARDRKRRAR